MSAIRMKHRCNVTRSAPSQENDFAKTVFLRASSRRLVAIQAARLTKTLLEDWETLKVSDLVSICRAWPRHWQYGVRIEDVDSEKKTPLRIARATAHSLRKIARQRQRLRLSVLRSLQRLEETSWRIILPSANAEQHQS
jgi:hypothetical protein